MAKWERKGYFQPCGVVHLGSKEIVLYDVVTLALFIKELPQREEEKLIRVRTYGDGVEKQ